MERPGTVYRFGSFEVDTSTGELLKHGIPVSIQEQPLWCPEGDLNPHGLAACGF